MSGLSNIIPTQIRNDSPELFESSISHSPTDRNSVMIQIHEPYDIRNDDINEDYVISYDNEYFTNSNTLSSENTLIHTNPLTENSHMIFRPIESDTLEQKHTSPTFVKTPEQRGTTSANGSVGVRGITGDDLSPKVIANTTTSHSNVLTKQLQQSFLEKVNNELYNSRPAISHHSYASKQKPHKKVSMQEITGNEINSAFDTFDASFSKFGGNYIKTDSMLFQNPATTSSTFNSNPSSPDNHPTPTFLRHPGVLATTMNYMKSHGRNIGETKNNDVQINALPSNVTDELSPPNITRSKLINAFLMTNTPLSSQTNSDAEISDNEATDAEHDNCNSRYLIQEHVENAISKRKMHFKKISYEEIERSLSKYYDKNNKYSNEVDILITFIRGQKHLYNQSCYITQIKLYALTITALAITSLITVVTPFIQEYWWKIIFVMSGNAITTVLITILKYMRFESACNTFTLLSNHYEHYEHSLQITSNKLVFIQDENQQTKIILDKMQEIEFKMRETAELCPIIIPVEVQKTFPVIYHTNIFTLIKKMDTHRKTLILQLKNIKNEIRYILYKWNSLSGSSTLLVDDDNTPLVENTQLQREKIRLLFLMEQKEKIKKELIEYKDNYSQIDDLFMKEIKYAESNKKCWKWLCCNKQKIQYNTYTNPVIKEHLELILS